MLMFLLPSEPLNIKKVHPQFQKQWEALHKMDFTINLYDHEQFIQWGQLISDIDFSKKFNLILKTFHLKDDQYTNLYNILKRNGIILINTPEQYSLCQNYPRIYKHIQNWAPKSIWFEEITELSVKVCREFINNDIIIKDFTKSEKGVNDLFLLSKDLTTEEFLNRVNKFKTYRGKSFSGGIVFKEFYKLKKFGDKTNEFRIHVLNNKIIFTESTLDSKIFKSPPNELLSEIIKSIDSNFFSFDIVQKDDNSWLLLQSHDGQVSTLSDPANEIIYFYQFSDFSSEKNLNLIDNSK